jgi:hypothetical protein
MTTTADTLVDLVFAALRDAGVAGGNVWSYRDFPTTQLDLPEGSGIVVLDLPDEDKVSLGRSGPAQFTTTATVPVIARMTRPGAPDQLGALALQKDLSIMRRQIEVAVINSPDLTAAIQQIAFVRSSLKIQTKERHVGELALEFGLEFYQGPEDFYPPPDTELEALELAAASPLDVGFVLDLTV